MPIKFNCPHCKKPLSVKEHLAGKKGACPACRQTLTVPVAPSAPAAPAAKPAAAKPAVPAKPPAASKAPAPAKPPPAPAAPPPNPADLEAEAAALFADAPAGPAEAPKTIDFDCPMCGEALHLSLDLAGKQAPCPECKRIIKVPEPATRQPKDWRHAAPVGPSGARRPDEPAPEGATVTTTVSRDALQEAGAIPKAKKVPLTRAQKVKRGVAAAAVLGLLLAGGLVGSNWWRHKKQEEALEQVLAYANSDGARQQVGPAGQAALHLGAGQYLLGTRQRDSGTEARKQFGKALTLLLAAPVDHERDLGLTELAVAQVDLGGSGDEVTQQGLRVSWDDTQKMLGATLKGIGDAEARLESLRAVARRLLARGEAPRVAALASLVYAGSPAELPEALAVAGLELLRAKEQKEAAQLVDRALAPYAAKTSRPPLRPAVVALAMAAGKEPPRPGKGLIEEQNSLIGQAEGLARQGKLDAARKQAQEGKTADVRFRALVGVAAADDAASADAAARLFEGELKGNAELSWPALRLIRLGRAAGLAEERLQAVAAGIKDRSLRGQAQLVLLRAQLEATTQVADAGLADKVEAKTLAQHLGREELARHNARLEGGYAGTVEGWDEPARAFGRVGVLLAKQGGK